MAGRIVEADGVSFLTCEALESNKDLGFAGHAFSTRKGGVSDGAYASLNLGLFTEDAEANVRENHKRFASAAGFDLARLTVCHQVHGDAIHVFEKGREPEGERPEGLPLIAGNGDGIITNIPNLPVGIFTADCYPVLLLDPVNKAVGACHAGWKGTILKITLQMIRRMARHFGTEAKNVSAVVGPGISRDFYEVGDNVVISIREVTPYWTDLVEFQKNRRWRLDLAEANRRQLINAGLPENQVHVLGHCTHGEEELFFSHRRSAPAGRQLSVIWIK